MLCPGHLSAGPGHLGLADLSSMARRRVNASYFSGLFSARVTEGLAPDTFGGLGENCAPRPGFDRGDSIPESTL